VAKNLKLQAIKDRHIKVLIMIPVISDYLKCVFSLPFLKPEVFDCFIDDLMTIKPVNAIIDTFCDLYPRNIH